MLPWQPATAADTDIESMAERRPLWAASRLELVGLQSAGICDMFTYFFLIFEAF